MYRIDLNADIGESYGGYTIGMDSEIIGNITSANIACGFHAGDPLVLNQTLKMAKENNVAVGAHPGYPDLMGFGRRNMKCTTDEIKNYVLYQLGAFYAFTKVHKLDIQHVKPHGAMYNTAAVNIKQAMAIAKAVKSFDPNIILLSLAGSKMIEAAQEVGIEYASEFFVDRAYEDDGTLVARGKHGAMITDDSIAIERIVRMVRTGKVETINGNDIDIKADSICVHGDNLHAVNFVNSINKRLKEENIEIRCLGF